jgi:ribosome-associated toxin RatA of RatAB toxin-antitoxin module
MSAAQGTSRGGGEEMVNISKSKEMMIGVEKAWEVLSDVDNDPQYWSQIRDIKVTRAEGNIVERDATVGPKTFSHKSHQVIVFDPKKTIKLTMTGGPIDGQRTITFVPLGKNSTRVEVEWELRLKDVPGFVQTIVKGQIAKATENALDRLAEAAEGGKA